MLGGRVRSCLSPAPGGVPAVSRIPWLVDASSQPLPSPSHGILPVCMSVSVSKCPLFIRTRSYWMRPTLMISTHLTVYKTSLPTKAAFTGAGDQVLSIFRGRHKSAHTSLIAMKSRMDAFCGEKKKREREKWSFCG